MRASKASPGHRVRFRVERADEIAAKFGKTKVVEKAAFFGVTHHNWSRVVNDDIKPGEAFIAAVLASQPDLTFDALFEVVAA